MPKLKLDHQTISGLEAQEKGVSFYDTIESGLILRLSKAGTKTFCYRYKIHGKKRRFTIGKFPSISLSQARKKVQELKFKVNDGIDPQAEKKQRRYKPNELTFKELAQIFSDQYLPTLKKTTSDQYQRVIDVELIGKHKWGDLNVSEITSQHVREVLNHKAHKENAFTMANRIRSTISKIFSYGLKHVGLKMNENPVKNTPVFQQGENVRDRVYNEDEIKELWEFWETKLDPIQSYYKILLLTGQRRTETMQMRWDDIDWEKPCKRIEIGSDGRPRPEAFIAPVWTITENKSSRVHEVPLSDMAVEIIERLRPLTGDSEYVFESNIIDGQPLASVKSTTNMIKKETSVSDFRLHDLRRTVATKMAESAVQQDVIKKILNHKEDGVTGIHYNWYDYADKKLEAMNRWSLRLQSILENEKQEAEITKLSA